MIMDTMDQPPAKHPKASTSTPSSSPSSCLFLQSLQKDPVHDAIAAFAANNDILRLMETNPDITKAYGARVRTVWLSCKSPGMPRTAIRSLLGRRPTVAEIAVSSDVYRESVYGGLVDSEAGFAETVAGLTDALLQGECGNLQALKFLPRIGTCITVMTPVMEVLGSGACPNLQALALTIRQPGGVLFACLSGALEARRGRSCVELKTLQVLYEQPSFFDSLSMNQSTNHIVTYTFMDHHPTGSISVAAALSKEGFRTVEELELALPFTRNITTEVIAAIGRNIRGLKTLKLHSGKKGGHQDPCHGLSHALSQGAFPTLEVLDCHGVIMTGEGMAALARALVGGRSMWCLTSKARPPWK